MPRKGKESDRKLSPAEQGFVDLLDFVVEAHFGTSTELAKAIGVTVARISHIRKSPRSIRPDTLEHLLDVIPSPVLQDRLLRTWMRIFERRPATATGDAAELVLGRIEELYVEGLIESAIALAEVEMEASSEYAHWLALAERLHPLYLRLDRYSDAVKLRSEIEHRAEEVKDMRAVVASLCMTQTTMHSLDAVKAADAKKAQERSLAAMEWWNPSNTEDREQKRWRALNMQRNYAVQILHLVSRRWVSPGALEQALQLVNNSFSTDSPAYMQASGLEVRSRIQLAKGDAFGAEETLEQLEAFGLDQAWDTWEKTRLTLSKAAERRGDRDEAIRILTDLRDRCRTSDSQQYRAHAEKELARLMIGIEA